MNDDMARADGTGLSQAEPEDSLGPTDFDPSRKPWFQFHRDALAPDCVTSNREPGSTFLRLNYEICRAIDMTSLSIILEKMAMSGWLDKREAELFHMQASGLLALIRTANNRGYAIAMEARQGGDACGSVHDSAGRNGIAIPTPGETP